MSAETCKEVWDHSCKSPANLVPQVPCRARCFACGEAVCTAPACSRVLTYLWYGRKRICRSCAADNGLAWAA
jgi:hypothetical protein